MVFQWFVDAFRMVFDGLGMIFHALGWFLEVSEVIWRAVEAKVELWKPWRELRGQILDTFIKSEGWGGGPGAEVTGVLGG